MLFLSLEGNAAEQAKSVNSCSMYSMFIQIFLQRDASGNSGKIESVCKEDFLPIGTTALIVPAHSTLKQTFTACFNFLNTC